MYFRYEQGSVFLDVEEDELDYFKHCIGIDDVPTFELSQEDINELAATICQEVFHKVGSDVPLIRNISSEWSGQDLAVEVLQTDSGVQFKMCPLSQYKGPDMSMIGPDGFNNLSHRREYSSDFKPMDLRRIPSDEEIKGLLRNDTTMQE